MQHSWYLDVDMQLFLIAPMFVYFLWRWVNLGLIVLISATLASLGVSVLVYVLFDLPPTLLFVRLYVTWYFSRMVSRYCSFFS